MISLENYEFRHEMKIVLRLRAEWNRMPSRTFVEKYSRKILTSLGRLLLFLSFFSPFFNNAIRWIQCTREVRRRMPLHAHQLFLLTRVSTFVKIQTSLSKDIIAFFDQTKPMAGVNDGDTRSPVNLTQIELWLCGFSWEPSRSNTPATSIPVTLIITLLIENQISNDIYFVRLSPAT